jgi:hypothetical protein
MVRIGAKLLLFDSTGSETAAYIHVLNTGWSIILLSKSGHTFMIMSLPYTWQRNLMNLTFIKPQTGVLGRMPTSARGVRGSR